VNRAAIDSPNIATIAREVSRINLPQKQLSLIVIGSLGIDQLPAKKFNIKLEIAE
jgi:hypothetical protein